MLAGLIKRSATVWLVVTCIFLFGGKTYLDLPMITGCVGTETPVR